MKIKDLRAHIQAAGIDPKYADVIESQAQRCVRFDAIPTDENELPLGCSKLGGSPDLPIGVTWPLHGDRRLPFVGQFNAHDFNRFSFCEDLPSDGILYFFLNMDSWVEEHDSSGRGNCRVLYHPGPLKDFGRLDLPERGSTPPRFNPCRIVFHEALSQGWHEIPIHAFHLDEAQEDEYVHIVYEFPDGKAHQVLGRPGRIENLEDELQLQCQVISHGLALGADGRPLDKNKAKELAPGAADWKLLLQLDSDEGAEMDWGDSMLSFWIRKRDLRDRNFSEVWMIEEWF